MHMGIFKNTGEVPTGAQAIGNSVLLALLQCS